MADVLEDFNYVYVYESAYEMTSFLRSNDSDFVMKKSEIPIKENIKIGLKNCATSYVRFIVRPPKVIGQNTEEKREGDGDGAYERKTKEQFIHFWPPPVAIIIISFFQVACFIAEAFALPDSSRDILTIYLAYNPCKRKEVWRLFTYMFVHFGLFHITLNVGIQLLLGIALECVHKWYRILLIYFVGIVSGSLLSSIIEPNVSVVGASGGLYTLLATYIASILLNWESKLKPISELFVVIFVILVDIIRTVYNRATNDIANTVSYPAHLAGGIIGFLLGIWLLKMIKPASYAENTQKNKLVNYFRWASLILTMILISIPVILNIFWTSHFC